jgi:hypothetical protein
MKTPESVLARYLWGVEPAYWRRRFRYRIGLLGPFVCFGTLWIGSALLLEGMGREQWFVATVLALAAMGVGRIGLRIVFGGDARRFRGNWQDYRLAGIPSLRSAAVSG